VGGNSGNQGVGEKNGVDKVATTWEKSATSGIPNQKNEGAGGDTFKREKGNQGRDAKKKRLLKKA